MGLEAVAVLHVSIDRFRAVLHAVAASPGTFRGLAGQRLELRESGDATLVHTHAPFSAEPEELGLVLRWSLGALLDEHEEGRGIFVYPSVARPKATGYAAIVEEIGEAGFWVPCVEVEVEPGGAEEALPPGGLGGSMRDRMGALPPGALSQAQQMLSRTDPGVMTRAAEQIQGALAGQSGDLAGVLERTMAQARDMLLAGGLDGLGGPDANQAPELWKQARAHVEALRESNPQHWQAFEQQIQQLAEATPGPAPPAGAQAAKPAGARAATPAGAKSKPAGAKSKPGRTKKRRRR